MSSSSKQYRVQEFANLAGVTVRALHHYDRLNLLQPRRTPAGYRVYCLADLERLEQIVALKFLGLSLKQIQGLLTQQVEPQRLPETLRAQRRALEDKRRHLDQAIEAIRDAERSLRPDGVADTQLLKKIIEVIEMQENNTESFKKYYDDDSWAKLAEKRNQFNPADQERVTADWQQLFADVRQAIQDGEDPAAERAQRLAARWGDLVAQFTGGDRQMSAGLNKAWQDRDNWPASQQAQTSEFADPQIWQFIQKAMAIRKGANPPDPKDNNA